MENEYDLTPYIDALYAAAVARTHDSAAAQDLAQETLLAALVALSRGKRPKNLRAWLMGILCNKYNDDLREKYNAPRIYYGDCPPEPAGGSLWGAEEVTPDIDEEYAGQLEAVRRELGYLARTHREVMVRFYMRSHSIEKIARDLGVPAGTVKSRLNTGRRRLQEGVRKMENYTIQSYAPDILHMSCSGETGFYSEPFSLVKPDDRLAQNILLLAYPKPASEAELARALGVPAAYIEPVVEKLVQGELMRRTEGGKVYTDFIIYTEGDRKATLSRQLEIAEKDFRLFWEPAEEALAQLRETPYYRRQTPSGQQKQALHFVIDLLLYSVIGVRDELTGSIMSYSAYPHRKNGGRWLAMGQKYPPDYRPDREGACGGYGIDGEAGTEIRNFRDAERLGLRKYDTALGRYPNEYFRAEYVKWLYERQTGVKPEDSAVRDYVLEATDRLLESGILTKTPDGAEIRPDIPVLSPAEYHEEKKLSQSWQEKLRPGIRGTLRPLFENGVRLPKHLSSVPNWQRYLFCADAVPMAVLYKARKEGRFLKGAEGPLPAALLVAGKR